MKVATYTVGGLAVEAYGFDLIDNRMYVIRSGEDVLIIDPFPEEELILSLQEQYGDASADVLKLTILLTHEHFDHICGINYFREHYPCRVIAGEKCKDILHSEDNGTRRFPFLFLNDKEKFHYVRENYTFPYVCRVDESFSGECRMDFAGHVLHLKEVPAHSTGSILIFPDDAAVFAGDNLLGNEQEIRSIDSDRTVFDAMIEDLEKNYDENFPVFPGHGEAGTLGEFLKRIRTYQ